MPLFRLSRALVFPDPSLAEPDGLLAVGGDLRPERLVLAYRVGLFPWFNQDTPILWWSPDPRFVLEPSQVRVGRSLAKRIRQRPYVIRADTAFEAVVRACGEAPRPGQDGTWITDEMVDAYVRLHRLGVAHSVEAWDGGALVGGLYGVAIGRVFFGESMFARAPDASKIAFVQLCRAIADRGGNLVDCQVPTDHLARFGAMGWPRPRFLDHLRAHVGPPDAPVEGLPMGSWTSWFADAG
jgi:leucyl/phenylalanyl-tRNA--protein transferase